MRDTTVQRFKARFGVRFMTCAAVGVVLGLVAAWTAGQSTVHTALPNIRLFVNERVTAAVKAQYPMRRAEDSIIIHESFFDPDGDGLFQHYGLFAQALANQVPRGYSGPVCFDWEGMGMLRLNAAIGSPAHSAGVQAFVNVIQFARLIRPEAQLGFYGIPMSEYWDRNEAWRQRNLALQPIVDVSDCLFPSVYDLYKTNEAPLLTAERDLQYVRECVRMALEMSGGRPVYAYVHPRYHPSNMNFGMTLIPNDEFKSHVKAVFETNFRGDKADGVVWWGDDRYYRWLSQQNFPYFHPQYNMPMRWREVFENEIPANTTDDAHYTTIHKRTVGQLWEVIRSLP